MSGYDEEKRFAVVAETRRRWSDTEKQAILAEAAERSGNSVTVHLIAEEFRELR